MKKLMTRKDIILSKSLQLKVANLTQNNSERCLVDSGSSTPRSDNEAWCSALSNCSDLTLTSNATAKLRGYEEHSCVGIVLCRSKKCNLPVCQSCGIFANFRLQ